jgi:hypothetical protein
MRRGYFLRVSVGLLILLAAGCTLFVDGENLWGPAFHIAVAGDRAYVCAGRNLLVLDIKDPSRPAKLGQLNFSDTVTSVEVSGGFAVVAVTGRGALTVDISNPARPVETGLSPPPPRSEVRPGEVFVAPFTYLNDTCVFYVLKGALSPPLRPGDTSPQEAVAGRAVLDPQRNVCGRSALCVQPPLAYLAWERHMYEFELGIIDVSDPSNPVLLGFCPIGDSVHQYPRAIVAANGFAYIAATLGGVVIVDVSDPTKPKVAARFKTSTQI